MVWSLGRHIWKLSKEPLYPGWHTGDMLNSHVISGLGMASAIQAGIKEYCGLLNTWKVDWKCTKPVSMVKEGLAACFDWQTDLGKIHDFF